VLKDAEAREPEVKTVMADPLADESPSDSTPPETMAAKETQASVLEPPASAGLVILVPTSGSVETSEPDDNSVLSPPLTRGKKTNKVHREKEVASNISLGSQKNMDPYIKGKSSSPLV
jgi:hypothetical protein